MKKLLLCLIALPASAAELSTEQRLDLACQGWTIDRGLIANIHEAHDKMFVALEEIDARNPTKPLADTMAKNLDTINLFSEASQTNSKPVWEMVCGD